MSYKSLDFSIDGGVAEIMLTRPEEANTLTAGLVEDLVDVVKRCEAEASLRAILLAAAEGPFFCAGGDLGQFSASGDQLPSFAKEMLDVFHPAMETLYTLEAPLIVAVNGAAAGIGCSFVLGASMALFAEDATFTMAYAGAGLTPDGGATYFLPRIVGMRRAEELVLTNRTLSAEEAVAWGIANQVVPQAQLLSAARRLARQIASGPTAAYGAAHRLLLKSLGSTLTDQMDREAESFARMCATSDCREGINAFLQKRLPAFEGK